MLKNYKIIKITEVADILGRPKKNQIYPEGCICLQVFAYRYLLVKVNCYI